MYQDPSTKKYFDNISFDEFLSSNDYAERVSVIPYYKNKSGVFWLLGKTHEGKITDIGGGCKIKENRIQCLIREIKEETNYEVYSAIVDSLENEPDNVSVWKFYTNSPEKRWYLLFVQITKKDFNFEGTNELKELSWYKDSFVFRMNYGKFSQSFLPFIRFFKYLS